MTYIKRPKYIKAPKIQYPTVEIIALGAKAREAQIADVLAFNPKYDVASLAKRKPNDSYYIEDGTEMAATPLEGDKHPETKYIESVTTYIKDALNVGDLNRDARMYINDADIAEAQDLLDYVTGEMMMQTIKGFPPKGFSATLYQTLSKETVTTSDVSMVSFISSVARTMKERQATANLQNECHDSKPLGTIGTKVAFDLTIITRRFLPRFDSYIYSGHDNKGNLVSFFRDVNKPIQFEIGSTTAITAKVKKFAHNEYVGGNMVTDINYIKLAK